MVWELKNITNKITNKITALKTHLLKAFVNENVNLKLSVKTKFMSTERKELDISFSVEK